MSPPPIVFLDAGMIDGCMLVSVADFLDLVSVSVVCGCFVKVAVAGWWRNHASHEFEFHPSQSLQASLV